MFHARSRLVPAALACAALAAVPAAALGHSAPTTLTVVEHANTDTEIPVAPGGKDAKGDPLTFINPVYDAADKGKVGHDEGFCERLNAKSGVWECLWTTFLHGGAITVQGPFYDHRDSNLAITGGTGIYQYVRGEMHLHALDGGKKYDFQFHLKVGGKN